MEEDKVAFFATGSEAGRFLQDKIKEGDMVLVKGSQSIRLERLVKEIMAEPLQASNLLCRQEESWLEKR